MARPVVAHDISTWQHMFRAYDIRGVYGKDLTPKIAETIAKGFGTYIGRNKNLAVGRDIRIGSIELKNAVVQGLTSTGCHVVDFGVVTTPLMYFGIAHQKKDGGIMVTASHNPAQWNGLKLCREKGIIVGEGSGIEKIKGIISKRNFTEATERGKVEINERIVDEYDKFISKKIKIERKLKVILDTGNSVPSIVAPRLFKKMGCEIETLNERLDGTFPSRAPEPNEESLQELISTVKEKHVDFGVGYDADGDRAVFVDNKGRMLTGDLTSIIFAKALITKPKQKVVYDVSCSSAVEEAINAKGGVPVVERVGRPFMMDRVLQENAVFGGERSGHFYFPDMYGLDDGTFASLKMAEILSKIDLSLAQMVDKIPKYFDRMENVPYPDECKFKVVKSLKAKFANLGFRILDIDGVKAQDDQGWILMRPSNTEPLVRIFAEGKTKQKLDQLLNLAKRLLKEEAEKTR